MGTPDFAVGSLRALHSSGFDIKAVVTQPDKERGRGRKVSFSPVKEMALELELPVLQPVKMKDQAFIDELREINADLFVVVAFRILPQSVLNIPPLGSVNLHASLLPQYRGAAPINYALFNGDKETGVTVFFLNRGVDTGEIISSENVPILPEDNYGSLYNKLAVTGSCLLSKTASDIFTGDFKTRPQDQGVYRTAPKIGPEDFIINWNMSAQDILNRIRGLSPKPGAYSTVDGRKIKIIEAEFDNTKCDERTGTVLEADPRKGILYIATGSGILKVKKIQAESKPVTDIRSFLNGNKIEPGARFL